MFLLLFVMPPFIFLSYYIYILTDYYCFFYAYSNAALKKGGLNTVNMKGPEGNLEDNGDSKITTTIAVWKSTKDKLDKNRAPGQCYNGFICQLVDLWERNEGERVYGKTGSNGGNHNAKESTIPY